MKVGIIETHYHSEFFNTLIQIFDNPTVYTTKKIYNDLPLESQDKAHFFFYNKSQTARSYLKGIPTHTYDYFFVNTIQPSMVDLYKWKHFNPSCPTILTLHNLEAWHTKTINIRKNIFHSADSLVSNTYREKILNKFDVINVVNPTLLSTAKKYFPDKKIICIPFAYAKKPQTPTFNYQPHFTIPGTVDSRRRDYQTVIDAFEPLYEDNPDLTLTFLGKSYDVIKPGFITWYKRRVCQNLYNSVIQQSDFIICPIRPTTHTVNTATEHYGITKSPNIFDAIKHRKPLIVPDSIPIPKELLSTTLTYDGSEQLFNICSEYLDNRDTITTLQKDAILATKNFTLDKIRKETKACLKKK